MNRPWLALIGCENRGSCLLGLSRQWRSNAERPQLLSSVSIGMQGDKGVTFKRLRLGDDQFKEENWPTEFALYRTILEQRLRLPGGAPPLSHMDLLWSSQVFKSKRLALVG